VLEVFREVSTFLWLLQICVHKEWLFIVCPCLCGLFVLLASSWLEVFLCLLRDRQCFWQIVILILLSSCLRVEEMWCSTNTSSGSLVTLKYMYWFSPRLVLFLMCWAFLHVNLFLVMWEWWMLWEQLLFSGFRYGLITCILLVLMLTHVLISQVQQWLLRYLPELRFSVG
jgi:hypothetical protein